MRGSIQIMNNTPRRMNQEQTDDEFFEELAEEGVARMMKELGMSPEEIQAYEDDKKRRKSEPPGRSYSLEEMRAQFAAWPKRKFPLRTIAEEEAEEARLAEEARRKES